MKRDMDLVRDLLLEIEKHPGMNRVSQYQFEPGDLGITEETYETVAFHLDLMIEAGLVLGKSSMHMPIVSGLTWPGAEFLDAVRDRGTWKTKEGAGKVGNWDLGFMLDLAKAIAKEEAKRRLGACPCNRMRNGVKVKACRRQSHKRDGLPPGVPASESDFMPSNTQTGS